MRTLIIVLRSTLVYQLLVPIKGLRFHESYSQLFSVLKWHFGIEAYITTICAALHHNYVI